MEIFKIQRSLAGSDPRPSMLVYNKDRSVWREGPLLPEIAEYMGARVKMYALGEIIGAELVFIKPVPDETW